MQCFNPYLPLWEFIPDGEPRVFGDRVYVFGSHDAALSDTFCPGDYVAWSAPLSDLGNWRREGVIYGRGDDPMNRDGGMCLFAPDVIRGFDGRYYLYYVLSQAHVVSVAVCDTPAGRYRFLGYVRDRQGNRLGERPGDQPQFDPAVLADSGGVWLYGGYCEHGNRSRLGCQVTRLAQDMLTVVREPETILPGREYAAGTEWEEHPYYEAPSIRKKDGEYYLVYSSAEGHELCWAWSDRPEGGWRYGGVVISNGDVGLSDGKRRDMAVYPMGNNHGGLAELNGQWYIFWHRHTNGTWFSRQGCADPVTFLPDGSIRQAAVSSCGLNGGPLKGEGEYPAAICCHLTAPGLPGFVPYPGSRKGPRVTREGSAPEAADFLADLEEGTVIGYKSFDFQGTDMVTLTCRRTEGCFDIATAWDGPSLGRVEAEFTEDWRAFRGRAALPEGVHGLYLRFRGRTGQLRSLKLEVSRK